MKQRQTILIAPYLERRPQRLSVHRPQASVPVSETALKLHSVTDDTVREFRSAVLCTQINVSSNGITIVE